MTSFRRQARPSSSVVAGSLLWLVVAAVASPARSQPPSPQELRQLRAQYAGRTFYTGQEFCAYFTRLSNRVSPDDWCPDVNSQCEIEAIDYLDGKVHLNKLRWWDEGVWVKVSCRGHSHMWIQSSSTYSGAKGYLDDQDIFSTARRDYAPPAVSIDQIGGIVTSSTYRLTGSVSSTSGVSRVLLSDNGEQQKEIVLAMGRFQEDLTLEAGDNILKVLAYDQYGHEGAATVRIRFANDALTIEKLIELENQHVDDAVIAALVNASSYVVPLGVDDIMRLSQSGCGPATLVALVKRTSESGTVPAVTEDDLRNLARAAVPAEVVVALVDTASHVPTLTPEQVVALTKAGVPGPVLKAVLEHGERTAAKASSPVAAAPNVVPQEPTYAFQVSRCQVRLIPSGKGFLGIAQVDYVSDTSGHYSILLAGGTHGFSIGFGGADISRPGPTKTTFQVFVTKYGPGEHWSAVVTNPGGREWSTFCEVN